MKRRDFSVIENEKKIFMPFDITEFLKMLDFKKCNIFFDCVGLLIDEKPLPSGIPTDVKLCLLHVISMQKFAPDYDNEESEVEDEQ